MSLRAFQLDLAHKGEARSARTTLDTVFVVSSPRLPFYRLRQIPPMGNQSWGVIEPARCQQVGARDSDTFLQSVMLVVLRRSLRMNARVLREISDTPGTRRADKLSIFAQRASQRPWLRRILLPRCSSLV